MKKLIFALMLIPSGAFAQQQQPVPTQIDYFKGLVASCTAESASLYEQANRFAARVQQLERELGELKKPEEKK